MDSHKLRDQHQDIRGYIAELRKICCRPMAPEPIGFYKLRRRFGASIVEHLKLEEWTVYPRLAASRDERTRAVAKELWTCFKEIEDRYRAYAARWTADAITADWRDFAADTLQFLRTLEARMCAEEQSLYPLIDRLPEHTEPSVQSVALMSSMQKMDHDFGREALS